MVRRALGVLLVFLAACAAGSDVSVERAAVERSRPGARAEVTTSTALVADESAGAARGSSTDDHAVVAQDAGEGAVTVPSAPMVSLSSRATPWSLEPYVGFGGWLDAFDWSVAFARSPENTVGVEAIDHMAAEGVETLYIQASRWNSETDVIEQDRLEGLIARAHEHDMAVVAWYLPTMVDPEADLRRLLAIAALDIDGLGVDIESRDVGDVAERNRRLLDISARLRQAMGDRALAAIVMEPVVMEDVNPNFWPGYPWVELAQFYDVWMPMSYWTNRRGDWRSAHLYTATNIARVRERIGQPDAPVHTIGGIGDKTTVDDLRGMLAAAVEQRAIGGSIYDYRTTQAPFWDVLRGFRSRTG